MRLKALSCSMGSRRLGGGRRCVFAYPAHILALGSRREGLRADDSAPSKKWPWGWRAHPPVLGSHHCGRWGQGLCVSLFVHLRKSHSFEATSVHRVSAAHLRVTGRLPGCSPLLSPHFWPTDTARSFLSPALRSQHSAQGPECQPFSSMTLVGWD